MYMYMRNVIDQRSSGASSMSAESRIENLKSSI